MSRKGALGSVVLAGALLIATGIQDPQVETPRPISDPAFRAIMFTDMVGSTEMTSRLGDELAVESVKAHDSIVRRCLERHGGREVKHLGDSIMASFSNPSSSVQCAVAVQREMSSYNEESENPIHVRIGIHAGEPIEEGNDLFGSAVQMAARICSAARADTVLVSGEVKDACNEDGLSFELIGSETLKGFSNPVPLFVPIQL